MKVLQEILVPLLSVNDQSLVIQELSFANGSEVKKGDTIALLETSKTTYTVEADAGGYVEYFCKAGEELPVNSVLAKIYDAKPVLEGVAENVNGKHNGQPKELITMPALKTVERTLFSAKALELLETYKLDKSAFNGLDLVSADDVRRKADPSYTPKIKQPATVQKASTPPAAIPADAKAVKLGSNKLREINYLSSVQSAGLVSVIHTHVEVEAVLPFLEWQMGYFKNSLLPLVVFETAKLLQKYPVFNAYYQDQALVYHNGVHVGFAVDLEKGLKVLKIADTNTKTIRQIEEEIIRLSGAYIDDKLLIDDLTDISFTITDLSNESVALFQPLVNMKNAAILGLSAIDTKLSRATLSLAFDHRVTEGKQAALFLSELKGRIQSYNSATLNGEATQKRLSAIACHRCQKTLAEDDSDVGFAKCLTADGDEGYICQSCFKGF